MIHCTVNCYYHRIIVNWIPQADSYLLWFKLNIAKVMNV